MGHATFAKDGELQVSALEDVFETGARLWGERGMAIDAQRRLLVVEGARESEAQSGRLRVVRGWVQSVLGSGAD